MKRWLCFALCLLLLFLCACKRQESEEEPPAPETGTFYTADGMLQNTLISLAIFPEDDLVAPVTKRIKCELHNDTGYPCMPGIQCGGQIYLYRWNDGAWDGANFIRSEGIWRPEPNPPKSCEVFYISSFMIPIGDSETDFTHELGPGLYRAYIDVVLWNLPEEYQPYSRVMAVTYFTVSAPE